MAGENPGSPSAGLSTEVNTGSPFLHTHFIRRCIHVMNLCSNVQRPVLLVGEIGVGKTLLMREKLRSTQALEGLQFTPEAESPESPPPCRRTSLPTRRQGGPHIGGGPSAGRAGTPEAPRYYIFTDGYVLSHRLHEHSEWKAANYFDPKNSRFLICFVDNLNMAKVESDNQETVTETIRHHLDHSQIFSRSTMSLNRLRNTVYNVTCDTSHDLSTQFTRHFAAFALHYPDKSSLEHIFTAVTLAKLSACSIGAGSKLSEVSEDRVALEEITGASLISPTYTPENPSGYNIDDFCADFTAAIVEAGVKSKKIVFLLQEHEVASAEFLVHVSEYVSSCSVAGLFSPEEQITIGNSLRSDLTQAGVSFNHDVAFQFFLK
eukprot:sb/3465732/